MTIKLKVIVIESFLAVKGGTLSGQADSFNNREMVTRKDRQTKNKIAKQRERGIICIRRQCVQRSAAKL